MLLQNVHMLSLKTLLLGGGENNAVWGLHWMWLLQGTPCAALWLLLRSPPGPRSTYFPGGESSAWPRCKFNTQHLTWCAQYGSGTEVTRGKLVWQRGLKTQSPFPIGCLRHTVAMSITDSQGAMTVLSGAWFALIQPSRLETFCTPYDNLLVFW